MICLLYHPGLFGKRRMSAIFNNKYIVITFKKPTFIVISINNLKFLFHSIMWQLICYILSYLKCLRSDIKLNMYDGIILITFAIFICHFNLICVIWNIYHHDEHVIVYPAYLNQVQITKMGQIKIICHENVD